MGNSDFINKLNIEQKDGEKRKYFSYNYYISEYLSKLEYDLREKET